MEEHGIWRDEGRAFGREDVVLYEQGGWAVMEDGKCALLVRFGDCNLFSSNYVSSLRMLLCLQDGFLPRYSARNRE